MNLEIYYLQIGITGTFKISDHLSQFFRLSRWIKVYTPVIQYAR